MIRILQQIGHIPRMVNAQVAIICTLQMVVEKFAMGRVNRHHFNHSSEWFFIAMNGCYEPKADVKHISSNKLVAYLVAETMLL